MYSKGEAKMKNRKIALCAALFLAAPTAGVWAQDSVREVTAEGGKACGMPVAEASVQRSHGLMSVAMELGLDHFDLDNNRVAVFTPVLKNGADSLELPAVGLYSRTRWYQYLRYGEQPLGGEGEQTIRWSERPDALSYREIFPYEEWMNGSELYLRRRDYGCCRTLLDEGIAPLTGFREVYYLPVFRYVTPAAASTKLYEMSNSSYIDFPVDRTEIYPEYRRNPIELQRILASIDTVRGDSDAKIDTVWLKGFASPESPYSHNTDLARGRVAALKKYIESVYHFQGVAILTDYEPEDWAGLRRFVVNSNIEHKSEILSMIDMDMDPDKKEALIKKTYPAEYKFMLQTWYPALRHTDYRIVYTIRNYIDLDEIRRVLHTAPQKLSQNEMFLLAQSLEPGSEEYNEVFEVAARMFPGDPVANLNAANAAMGRNDFTSAARYLEKAGDSAEAVYARGVLAALNGDYETAESRMLEAAAMGLPDTEETLANIAEVKKYL